MSKVYWVEMQSKLSGVGLNISVNIPTPGHPWNGHIDEKPFIMTITPDCDKNGLREFLVISLYGQDEDKVIPLLGEFMGYKPFCKYLNKENSQATATYEWDVKNPEERLGQINDDEGNYEIQMLNYDLNSPEKNGIKPEKFFQQFDSEIVATWENAVKENPEAEWSSNKIQKLLPFIKKALPRIGRNQSLFGLSIISLDSKFEKEEEVVRYGLEPLLKAGILTENEVEKIVYWYTDTQPTWDSGGAGAFQKGFEVDGVSYKLITDSYRNCRDLNLQC